MKAILALIACLILTGCATYKRVAPYIPASPVTMGTGDIALFKVIRVGGYVQFINPFAEAVTITNGVPAK